MASAKEVKSFGGAWGVEETEGLSRREGEWIFTRSSLKAALKGSSFLIFIAFPHGIEQESKGLQQDKP